MDDIDDEFMVSMNILCDDISDARHILKSIAEFALSPQMRHFPVNINVYPGDDQEELPNDN